MKPFLWSGSSRIDELTSIEAQPPESSHVFPRKFGVSLPCAVSAHGVWVYDAQGNAYLDASGGAAVVNVGHGVPEIVAAIATQASTLGYVNGTQFTHSAVNGLAEALTHHLEKTIPDPRFYFLCTGTDAVEAAMKLARQYWVLQGQPKRVHFISRSPSYHGCSLATLSLSDRPQYKAPFGPLMIPQPTIPAPWGDDQDLMCADALEHQILVLPPQSVAAFIAEPIGGSSTGAAVPSLAYWDKIQEICKKYQVLLIADEVMCGMGRTGTWLASEHFGLKPDVITLGKGLNGGYAPLSAMVASGALVNVFESHHADFLHAGTYSHTPVICAAGLATVRYLETQGLVQRSLEMGEILHQQLQGLKKFSFVGEIRGKGLFAGIEFWQDPTTKTPFPRDFKFVENLVKRAFAHGLVLWSNAGYLQAEIEGQERLGDLILLAPPFVITQDEIEMLVHRLEKTLTEISKSLEAFSS
ncbi:MAG: aspartate aminotransferase family protein [Cyanobacteria bacterium]|nr:aspartate aminotransferase family protein [Cyanobacteriota bacterium]